MYYIALNGLISQTNSSINKLFYLYFGICFYFSALKYQRRILGELPPPKEIFIN